MLVEAVGGALTPHHPSSITPNRKRPPLHLHVTLWERGPSPCPATTQPMKSHYTSDGLPVSSNGLFDYKGPSKLPLSSIKKVPLLCSWDLAWFTIRSHVLSWNFLLFPNKPILLEKYLVNFLFKVNKSSCSPIYTSNKLSKCAFPYCSS